MFKQILCIIFCLIALIIEGAITTAPFVLMLLVLLYVFDKKNSIFFYGFVSGSILDVMQVRPLGSTALFFLPVLFLLSLYQRKFEITSLPFVLFALLLSSYGYALLFLHKESILQAAVVTIIGSAIYLGIAKITPIKQKKIGYA